MKELTCQYIPHCFQSIQVIRLQQSIHVYRKNILNTHTFTVSRPPLVQNISCFPCFFNNFDTLRAGATTKAGNSLPLNRGDILSSIKNKCESNQMFNSQLINQTTILILTIIVLWGF